MKIAIVGSRGYRNLWKVVRVIDVLAEDDVVVSGGAHGVDETAARAARGRGLEVVEHLAEWKKHGRRAGILRNGLIVQEADVVVAFWDGKSPGTASSIDIARDLRRPHRTYLDDRTFDEEDFRAWRSMFTLQART